MINMQQLILGQVSGSSEQPQEEVQLTELLPVKQSRIRENNVFKDIDATDALKALRSFSGGCNEEEQDFGLRIFDENGRDKDEIKTKRGCGTKRKSNHSNLDNLEKKKNSSNERDIDHRDATNCKRSMMSKKRNVARKNSKKVTSGSNKKSVNKDRTKDDTEEDDDDLSVLYDDEIPTYLDLDKTKDSLNDEVYVFRRERSNSCSLSQTSSEVNHDNTEEIYENDYQTTDGDLIKKFTHRSKNSEISTDELNSSVSEEERTTPTTDDNPEKELRLKIDAIIQANFLVERGDNNNVVSQDRKKLNKKVSSSKLSSSPSPPSRLSNRGTSEAQNGSNFSDEETKRSEDDENHEKSCHPEIEHDVEGSSNSLGASNDSTDKTTNTKYRTMTVERMRLLLAVLLKRISKQERLDELGFGKRLIDKVLHDSLISAGKDPATGKGLSELETLTKNLETFLEWTVPKEHWENFRRMKKTPEDILETLTAT
ncbi:zinc finger protein 329-like [Vespula maculifrons]|uniref:Zinc finger protein 329-like n=1 Tax=Vespula maculifrons TaxID=7453 RepID=A0ABD2C0E7_VESMC